MQINLVLNCVLPCVECLEALLHTSVIDAQKLVLRRRHIDKIRFAFAALLIEKLIYRLIFRRFFSDRCRQSGTVFFSDEANRVSS